jgi:hypothetical protein
VKEFMVNTCFTLPCDGISAQWHPGKKVNTGKSRNTRDACYRITHTLNSLTLTLTLTLTLPLTLTLTLTPNQQAYDQMRSLHRKANVQAELN